MKKLKISIGPVELYARLLDTPAAEAICTVLPFSSEARVSDSIVSFLAPGAAPLHNCGPGARRAGDFILSNDNSVCGIDINRLPFVRSTDNALRRPGDVWARAMGDIAALKHVIDGDPVSVEAIE